MQTAKLPPKCIYLNRLEQLEKYDDDNVWSIIPCTVPVVCYICSQVVAAGMAVAAGWNQGA